MPEVMPVTYQASHLGMKVERCSIVPMSMNREADPKNEIARDIKILVIMLVIRSFLSRFLNTFSVSCMYSLRMVFTSSSNAWIISFMVGI